MVVDLDIDEAERGEYTVVSVGGEIDVYTAPVLRERLTEVLDRGVAKIVVDLSQVQFLDSTGLGVLVVAMRRVEAADGSMVVVCDRPHILKVFEITGLSTWFDIRSEFDEQ
ncbi:MAG: STAS domain-containing protein [Acidimicrobiia bacterium]|nr:STAS domain-containing protein [Acidimicrobiia bacterium]